MSIGFRLISVLVPAAWRSTDAFARRLCAVADLRRRAHRPDRIVFRSRAKRQAA